MSELALALFLAAMVAPPVAEPTVAPPTHVQAAGTRDKAAPGRASDKSATQNDRAKVATREASPSPAVAAKR